jgi:hypothetical protein
MLVLKFAGTVSQHPRLLHIQDIAISHPHPVLNNTRIKHLFSTSPMLLSRITITCILHL